VKSRNKAHTKHLQAWVEGLLRYGAIDPNGKSTQEIHQEITEVMDEATSDADQHELACVFYAVWFEHWLNHMTCMSGLRKNLNEQDIQEILRHARFESKATWILRVLGVRPIAETHLRRMQKVTEARNAFVHYKWKAIDFDKEHSEKREHDLKLLLGDVEHTVNYLRRLEGQQIFDGKKRAILARFEFGQTSDMH